MAHAGAPSGALRSGAPPTRSRAIVSMGRCVAESPMRCGRALGQRVQSLQGEAEMRAALVPGHRVDLVDDHRPHAPELLAALLRRHEQIERFGRGHQDVGRPPGHGRARARRRVAGPHLRAQVGNRHALLGGEGPDLGQRRLEILVDVAGQRLERRHVHHVDGVGQRGARPGPEQAVDADEEGGQRLARAGGRGDQDVAPRRDERPALDLRRHRPVRKAPGEPLLDDRMESGERVHAAQAYSSRRAGRDRSDARRRPAPWSTIRHTSGGRPRGRGLEPGPLRAGR